MAKKTDRRHAILADVARLADVSPSTVSRVLSGSAVRAPISEETRARVRAAAEQLGYYPNVNARSLRTQRTNMIAVMIADISNPFYHTITRAIQDAASAQDFDVLIANTDHIHSYEQRFVEAIMRRPVDGVIMVPYNLTAADIEKLIDRTGVAVAVLAHRIEHPRIDVVYADDEGATTDAVRWLITEKGHQKIAFIGVNLTFKVGQRRYRGYQRALEDCGIRPRDEWFVTGDFSYDSGAAAMSALLDSPERPTAVFVCNDIMAIGALNVALERGLRVPEDIAIVGFDNIPATQYMRPELTTVAQFPQEIGTALATALFERIADPQRPRQTIKIGCELIVRQST